MSIPIHRLCASPPAVRIHVFRHALALASQAPVNFSIPFRRGLHNHTTTYTIRRPFQQQKIRVEQINRRFDSTATAATAAPTPTSTTSPTPPPKSRTRRFLTSTALVLVFFTLGISMAAAPAAETVNGYVNPVSDAETLHLYHPSTPGEKEVDEYILQHPLSRRLRADPSLSESRPTMRIPPAMRPHNLTAGTLLGEGMITVPPLNFNNKKADLPTLVQIMYLGSDICGHDGIVHGGLLATLLDEGLARACFPALPNKVGVTASLKIDYRVPCPAGRYVVLKAETTKVDGRKVWSKGWIEMLGEEDSEGTKMVEAEALYIEPKNAKNMVRNVVASDD